MVERKIDICRIVMPHPVSICIPELAPADTRMADRGEPGVPDENGWAVRGGFDVPGRKLFVKVGRSGRSRVGCTASGLP